ncbi:hypothetical protein Dda3937_04478 [Dickeya dadantii 3937]|uniref:Restriction endonuclease type IV Mrr domain-containing protein n=1 Tax=Dickeya dadantii (strain 3937) TaxID=198628 RepID=E0SAJ9_DICD3|nr:restriction endonuclease [Dickeya dadantii]ADM97057.1 hypothetical protein Dda3937_04478 [Dickeya dadantii 3937]
MGVLEEAIIGQLINTNSVYKRDVMEARIRSLLGAEPFTEVTGLPPRRGRADGGIDGIVNFRDNSLPSCPVLRAAINIKVRSTDFSREQLGGFILDMDRENISVGLIITAANLSPDAKAELERKNTQGQICLYHIRLSDIISPNSNLPDIEINGQTIHQVLSQNIRNAITS